MGCLWCGKYSRQCKTMPSGPPEFIPPFIPVTGMKCSYGKISSPLTEISGTEPARPLIWTHRKFYKGFRGEARSWKPGSYEEALNSPGLSVYPVGPLRIVHATCDCFYLEAHFSLLVNVRNRFHLDNVKMFCTSHFKPKHTLIHDAFCCNVFTVSYPWVRWGYSISTFVYAPPISE